jgi:hypothetical protein
MRAAYLLVGLLFLGSQDPSDNGPSTQDPDAPHQRAEPPEYPEGVSCTPAGDIAYGVQTGEHPCACKRMIAPDHDCDTAQTLPDPVCAQYCHEKHCACPITCEEHHE